MGIGRSEPAGPTHDATFGRKTGVKLSIMTESCKRGPFAGPRPQPENHGGFPACGLRALDDPRGA